MLKSDWTTRIDVMARENRLSAFALSLYKEFGSEVFERSVIPLCHAEEIFDKVLKDKGHDTIIDIGTGNGIPAAYMSQYCSRIITIDVIDNPMRKEVLKFCGIKNVGFLQITAEKEKERFLRDLIYDFCYMDGAHATYTYSDWMMVRKCGHVLFHEYYEAQKPVFDLVNSLPSDEVKKFIRHNEIYASDSTLSELPCVDFAYWQRGGTK